MTASRSLLRFDWLLAPLLGALATLGFPPFDIWYLPVLALAGLFALCADRGWKRAFGLGWGFGFGHFASGIYWVVISTHVYGGAALWLSLGLATVLFAYLAVYPALACALASAARVWHSRAGWLCVAAFWLLGELLRGWVYSGFPWLSLGYAGLDMPAARLAPLIGVHGLSALLAFSAYALMRALGARGANRSIAVLAAALPLAGGLLPAPTIWTQDVAGPMSVAIVQGNVPQDQKWDPARTDAVLERYREMTLAVSDAQLIVWPEAVPNATLDEVIPYFHDLRDQLGARGAALLAGVLIRGDTGTVYNSMIALGAAHGRYDKRHLVPFGEYFPIPDWLRPVMVALDLPYGDISSGDADTLPRIEIHGQVIGVSICFEDVFSDEFARASRAASVLVNATNDAWFARSSAGPQHLQIARMRALETGRWLIRATNTGISAFIAPDGQVRARSGQYTTELMRGQIIPRGGLTPYARWGDQPLWMLSALALVGGLFLKRKRAARVSSPS
ncbi:MAG: apolipoprotein N-acyltransferase [Panacagrimonas sp.]